MFNNPVILLMKYTLHNMYTCTYMCKHLYIPHVQMEKYHEIAETYTLHILSTPCPAVTANMPM